MALNIEFEGYVNEIKTFSWGTVVKMSHNQRAKNDATGEWETVGKDYIDVTLPEGAGIPAEKSIARVKGTFKLATFQKRDGSTGIAINVRATEMHPVERRGGNAADNLAAVGATRIEEDIW